MDRQYKPLPQSNYVSEKPKKSFGFYITILLIFTIITGVGTALFINYDNKINQKIEDKLNNSKIDNEDYFLDVADTININNKEIPFEIKVKEGENGMNVKLEIDDITKMDLLKLYKDFIIKNE